MPTPFLVAGALLFMTGPQSPDVVVVSSDGYDHPTTTTTSPTTTTTTSTTVPATTSTIPGTNPVTVPTSVVPTTIERKVTICHLPPGNPPNFQIIEIGISALTAHLAHGDIYPVPVSGVCFTPPTTVTPTTVTPTTSPPVGTPFAIEVTPLCPDGTVPLIEITFGNRPDLDGQVGTLTFSTGGSVSLTFDANGTVEIPYPASAGTGPVTMTYTLGAESVTRSTSFPEACTPSTTSTTTSTTIPGTTTTSSTTSSTVPSSTTTVPGTPTPTTLPPDFVDTFDIGAGASVCTNDVPFIELTFGNEPQFNGLVGTITFTTLDGDFIETVPVTYQANTTIRLVFPGASFDPVTGEATDWPGWRLNEDGFWVTDPTDEEFRDGIVVIAELPIPVGGLGQSLPRQVPGSTLTASTTVTYPPETAACNSPTGPFPPGGPGTPRTALPQGDLPATGAQGLGLALLVVGIAIGLGNASIQIGRKRT